jgi:hypothetical protein
VIRERVLELAGPLRVITLLTAAVLVAATFTVSATPAMASAGTCAGGGIWGYPYYSVCTDVNGGGLHIDSMSGQFFNHYIDAGANNIHIQLFGPRGTIKNCPAVNVGPRSSGPKCWWSPNSNEPGGNYCATAWQALGGSNYDRLATACINVHR